MNNWMRDLKRVYTTAYSPTMVATAGNYLHVNVEAVPNDVILKRFRIIGSGLTTTGSNQLDIKILSDGAAYRAAEAASSGSGEPYVIFSWEDEASETGPNTLWLSDVTFSDEVEYRDDLHSNNLYVRINSEAALTGGATFRVDLWGEGLPNTHWTPQGNAPNTQPAVWRWSTGDIWTGLDVRNPLDNANAAIRLFTAATDYVYFGMPAIWDGLWFNLVSANTTAGTTATWQYYNGSTWVALTVRDNCTDASAVNPTIFSYGGVISWTEPTDWAATDLSTLSLGTPPYDGSMPLGQYGVFPTEIDSHQRVPRYWVRLKLSNLTTQPVFKWVRERPVI